MISEKARVLIDLAERGIPFEYDGELIIVEMSRVDPKYRMPFDRRGMHATGREAFDGNVWWTEYDAGNGKLAYLN